ncbi:MAG: Mobile element protein, partial [uncultured Caballeronia sp.]
MALAFVQTVLSHARMVVEEVQLTIALHNEAAQRLYRSVGFVEYAREPRSLKIDGKWNERPTTRWVTPRWVTPKRRTLTGRRHQSAQMEDHRGFHRLSGGSEMKVYDAVGADIAKNVFQLHWVDAGAGEIVNKQLKRAAFREHFANREPCLVGMEACGGAQHWARRLMEMGHQVELMPAKFVKAFNIGNKNDPADARAIRMATQMPTKPIAVKTEAQQAVLALHRLRQQKIEFRTMQMNSLRGLLTEYGEVMAKSRAALDKAIPGVLAKLIDALR